MGSVGRELPEAALCACLRRLVPAWSLERGDGRPGRLSAHPILPSLRWSPRDVAVPSVTATPTPGRRCCPHRFPPSRLSSSVKGVSGSQASHNFSPGLQLLARGASPPTPPRPGAAPPVSPAPTRRPPESTFRDGAAGNRHPDLPEPRNLWALDGLGEGGTEGATGGGRFCCQTASPLRPQRHERCPGQTSRPRKQGWRAGGTQHPLNCEAKQCTWAAEAPEASCTPTSNKARSWVPPPLRAEICPPPAPTDARSQSLLPPATPYRSRRGPGRFAARRH